MKQSDRFERFEGWRRKGIGVLGITVPKNSFAPRSEWGKRIHTGSPPGYDWITLTLLAVPEGAVSIIACSECGARRECLMDMRGDDDDGWTLSVGKSIVESRARLQPDLFHEEHLDCKQYERCCLGSPAVEAFYRRGIAEAADQLKFGGVKNARFYLTTDDCAFLVPITQQASITEDEREARGLAIQEDMWSVREMVRARNKDFEAMCIFSEAWMAQQDTETVRVDGYRMPATAPDRQEVLIATLVTPEFARSGVAPIVRKVADEGPGTLGEWRWFPLGVGSQMVDGAIASTRVSWVPDPFTATGYDL